MTKFNELLNAIVEVSKESARNALNLEISILEKKEITCEYKELKEGYDKLRLHCNKMVADKKQAEKELEEQEKIWIPQVDALNARCFQYEKDMLASGKFEDYFKN